MLTIAIIVFLLCMFLYRIDDITRYIIYGASIILFLIFIAFYLDSFITALFNRSINIFQVINNLLSNLKNIEISKSSLYSFIFIPTPLYLLPGTILGVIFYKRFGAFAISYFFLKDTYFSNLFKKIKKNKTKLIKKLNEELDDLDFQILMGIDAYTGDGVYLEEDFHNAVIAGSSQTGKTTTGFNILDYYYTNNRAIIFMEGKGFIKTDDNSSAYEKVLENYSDFIIIDMSSRIENKYAYNPFKYYDGTTIADMLIALSDWSEEFYKSAFKNHVLGVLDILSFFKGELNIDRIIHYLDIDNLRLLIDLEDSRGNVNKELFSHLSKQIADLEETKKIVKDSLPRLKQLNKGVLKKLFDTSGRESINVLDVLNEKKQLLFIMDSLSMEETVKIIGDLIILDYRAAMSYTTNNENKLLFMDEVNTFISDNAINVANKGLGMKTRVVFSFQSPMDIIKVNPTLFPQIIDNVNNYFIQRVNSNEAVNYFAEMYGTHTTGVMTSQYDADDDESQKGSIRGAETFNAHPNHIRDLLTGEGAVYMKNKAEKHELVYMKKRI